MRESDEDAQPNFQERHSRKDNADFENEAAKGQDRALFHVAAQKSFNFSIFYGINLASG
jgi:hypothetical protein